MDATRYAVQALNYLSGPTGPTGRVTPLDVPPDAPVTVVATYFDGSAWREFPVTDYGRAYTLATGRLARSAYQHAIGKPDGLMWIALVPTDARGNCAQCAPTGVTAARHTPESCPRALR